jgi:hypothetical protein
LSPELEQTARRIAERGEDALIARLRGAFEEAAAAHADALALEDGQLERLVQGAAERADGLQWRRALAAVATDELGIGLGEALGHPAVVRAHAILGAPSYEAGLARLGPLAGHPETGEIEVHLAVTDSREREQHESEADEPGLPIRVTATHLGGIADLASPEPGVELWFSEEGLDIIRPSKEPLGRLTWDEVRGLEVPEMRGRFARRRRSQAYLVIRGQEGDASFEVPGMTPEELREQLDVVDVM